jgi:site-specific DNA-methyltransferase (adenine-specific)
VRTEVIGNCALYNGDCLEVLPLISDAHSCVTDPPYHLTSVKRFSGKNAAESEPAETGVYKRPSKGFMGKTWDGGDIAFQHDTWRRVYNALMPGGHIAAFSSTRTYHRMACAIEDAGFEIRDMLSWLYGSGFPKSHDVSKTIDKRAGAEREIIRERKGVTKSSYVGATETLKKRDPVTAPATAEARLWHGWGTALKPACEPICFGRRPLIGSVAQNVLTFGTGAINIDASLVGEGREKPRVQSAYSGSTVNVAGQRLAGKEYPDDRGRWPANVLHDGSIEVVESFPAEMRPAVRFFYSPKASREEREFGLEDMPTRQWVEGETCDMPQARALTKRRNHHPTVKPIDLMAWLCRLITPPNGTVLDPFMGSGSTGIAAVRCAFGFVGIERDPEYFDIACRRIEAAVNEPDLFLAAAAQRETHHTPDLFEGTLQ